MFGKLDEAMIQNNRDRQVAPFPTKLVGVAAVLTLAVLAWLSWFAYDTYKFVQDTNTRIVGLERARGDIIHLDEVLTMSASMAAATGEVEWIDRYWSFEPKLDAAIKQAIDIAQQPDIADAIRETDAANVELVKMENKAFAFVRVRRLEEAREILSGTSYSDQKQLYASGMNKLLRGLRAEREATVESQRTATLGSLLAMGVVAAVIILAWIVVLGRVREWRTAMSKNVNDLVRAEEALRESHDDLERRVTDRTRELVDEINERKHAEENARRLANAIEGLSEIFALYGPDEKLVICNENYRRLNEAIPEATRPDVSYEEHMRAVVDKGLIPKAIGREEDYIRERMERYRNPTGPYEVFRQDRVWLVHDQRVADGSMAVIATDITQLKRAEEAKERLSQAVENVPVGIVLFDSEDRVVFFNSRYAELMEVMADILKPGVSFEEMVRTMVDRQPVKEAQGREEEYIQERIKHHRNPTGSFDIRREDMWLSTDETRLADGSIFTIITDITELKQAEEDRQLALVKAGDALIEAELANQAKSEFLASMSHDLRTPLNAIIGFADILSGQYFGPISDKYQEYATDIHSSGEHLLELVNDILDLSTIEAGKQSVVKEKLSILEIVTECERIVEDKARSNGIDLVTEFPKDLPPFYADKRASKQILLNLLSNAVKFTPQGGRITVSVKASKKNTTLKVADTGKGIPADKLPKLTDPFTRGEHDPYLTEEGWGLGLTITKSLVDLHDGTLDIKSKIGKGTTVTVTFPNGAP